ncbi:MAG: hypothetical protein Q9202_006840 [Teloschistes flavicans]
MSSSQVFLEFDILSLTACDALSRDLVSGRFNIDSLTAISKAASNLREIAAIQEDLSLIQSRRLQFHQDILKNQLLVGYTATTLSILSAVLEDPSMDGPIQSLFDLMLSTIRNVPDKIVIAAQNGSLDSEMRVALRRRWEKIKETFDWMDRRAMVAKDKWVPHWADIMSTVEKATPRTDTEKTDKIVTDRLKWLNTVLWATFASNVCLTIPFLWKAYQYSPHTAGTREDSDFWFLVQSSVSQSIGLLISALGLWKLKSTPLWVWLPPTTIAAVCDILAMPLYLFAPTEWSYFCVMVAGAIQSFMVLQLAIAEH